MTGEMNAEAGAREVRRRDNRPGLLLTRLSFALWDSLDFLKEGFAMPLLSSQRNADVFQSVGTPLCDVQNAEKKTGVSRVRLSVPADATAGTPAAAQAGTDADAAAPPAELVEAGGAGTSLLQLATTKPTKPTVPLNFFADETATTGGMVTLHWDLPADLGGTELQTYRLWYAETGAPETILEVPSTALLLGDGTQSELVAPTAVVGGYIAPATIEARVGGLSADTSYVLRLWMPIPVVLRGPNVMVCAAMSLCCTHRRKKDSRPEPS